MSNARTTFDIRSEHAEERIGEPVELYRVRFPIDNSGTWVTRWFTEKLDAVHCCAERAAAGAPVECSTLRGEVSKAFDVHVVEATP